MANSAGLVIVGLAIGIVLAAQADELPTFDPPDLTQRATAPTASGSDENPAGGAGSGESPDGQSSGAVDSVDAGPPHGLTTPGVINTMDSDERLVALTFSSGPDPEYTSQVLAALERQSVTATFCLTGEEVREHPIVVQNIVADGHTLCNQGETLAFELADRDDDAIEAEISDGLSAIEDTAPDAAVPFFRAPGGDFSAEVNQIAGDHGHQPLGWDVDPRDWERTEPEQVVRAVVDSVEPGSIVVLHDGDGDRSVTVAALDPLIEALRDAGYEFTVPDLR